MDFGDPPFDMGERPQIDDPELGQTCRHQQAKQSLGVADVALVDRKATAFLVGKERFNMKPLAIPVVRLGSELQIGHQI